MDDLPNPYAFPSTAIADRFRGMSLRDWFAGQALAGMLASGQSAPWRDLADHAFAAADAMLSKRAS